MKKKRLISLLLAVALCFAAAAPAWAAADEPEIEIYWLLQKASPIEYRHEPGEPSPYNQELGWLTLRTPGTGEYFVVDLKTGNTITDYKMCTDTHEGFVIVAGEVNGELKWGYADTAGKLVVPLEYDIAYPFSEGMALVGNESADGTLQYGYIDKKGNCVISIEYDEAESFSEGLAAVATRESGNEKWGFIDATGKVVIPFLYDSVQDGFVEDRAVVGVINQNNYMSYGVIDKKEKVIIPFEYSEIDNYSGGCTRAGSGHGFHAWYFDINGQQITNFDIYEAGKFSEGLAPIIIADKPEEGHEVTGELISCLINSSGEIAAYLDKDCYAVNGEFSEGLCLVQNRLGWEGYINQNGEIVIPFRDASFLNQWKYRFYGGIVTVGRQQKYGFMNKEGKVIIPMQYDVVGNLGSIGWVQKGDSVGIFVNPYWEKDADESKPQPSFTDVAPSAYYAEPVAWAVKNGITNGTSANTFSPNAACTRGQIVTFLWRAAGEPEPFASRNPFVDVKPSDYYYKAVLWAVENNITSGTGAGQFSPSAPCTRAQAVTFLWRAKGQPAGINSSFSDVPGNSFYKSAVDWAVARGITTGTGGGKFSPSAACTRGQIVTFLYRASDLE